MRIRSQELFCRFAAAALLLAACGQNSATEHETSLNSNDANSGYSVANLLRATANMSEVDVFNLVVANTRDNGAPARSLHFVTTGASDFAEVQLCSSTKGCDDAQKFVVDEVILNTTHAGQYTVRVRACVFPERAPDADAPCSEWRSTSFEMSATTNAEISALISERNAKRAELAAYSKAAQQALEAFLKNSQECAKRAEIAQLINAIRGLVQNYLALGEGLINRSMQKRSEKESEKYSGAPVSGVQKPLAENNEKLAKFMEYNAAVQKVAKARGYFDEALPVNATQMLGLAVFDLFTAKKQIPGVCLAKDIADREMAAISNNIGALKTRISEIETLIAERSAQ
jgi:hypothetical protein